jgi:hypothetical protein
VLWATLHKVVEPLLNHTPLHALREKACAEVMKQVHYEDENTRYIDIGPVNKASIGALFYLVMPFLDKGIETGRF